MNGLQVFLQGIGVRGPGMAGWEAARAVLRHETVLELSPTILPPAEALPPAERRRIGIPIKLSMAVGFEAAHHAGIDPAELANVFSSTGGDCDNCHAILETLASSDRQISPTRFHNSVHNAPSGYWGIATHCMAPSTSLCAFDATFAAALLEAASQTCASGKPCLLVAYDTAYPQPLYAFRPIPHPFSVAMVLSPERNERSLAELRIRLSADKPHGMSLPALEALRAGIPAARSLPLLEILAQSGSSGCVLEYLEGLSLAVEVRQ